mgnify:CR=1 FL=1
MPGGMIGAGSRSGSSHDARDSHLSHARRRACRGGVWHRFRWPSIRAHCSRENRGIEAMTQCNRDLTGQRFGSLLVESKATGSSRTKWRCLCDCGQRASVTAHKLKSRHTKSCGCLRGANMRSRTEARETLVGKKFGKLTVLSQEYGAGPRLMCVCLCACGTSKTMPAGSLITARYGAKSCGCTRGKGRTKAASLTSKYKGVNRLSAVRIGSAWIARIGVGRTRLYLGCFDTEESAALAYDAAARKYFGQAALTNADMELYPWSDRTEGFDGIEFNDGRARTGVLGE